MRIRAWTAVVTVPLSEPQSGRWRRFHGWAALIFVVPQGIVLQAGNSFTRWQDPHIRLSARVIDFGVMTGVYVLGYRLLENDRLRDPAGTLVDILHTDTGYPADATAGPRTGQVRRNSRCLRVSAVRIGGFDVTFGGVRRGHTRCGTGAWPRAA